MFHVVHQHLLICDDVVKARVPFKCAWLTTSPECTPPTPRKQLGQALACPQSLVRASGSHKGRVDGWMDEERERKKNISLKVAESNFVPIVTKIKANLVHLRTQRIHRSD